MKSTVSFTQLCLIALAAVCFPHLAGAQRSDESVRVKVHKTQEGHTLQIEEAIPAGDAQDLQQLMNKYGVSDELKDLKPGEEVEIVIRRKQGGEETNDVTIEMDRKPAPKVEEKKPAFLGVHYEMEFGSTKGSHITKVEPGTPAAKAGLKAGDVITQADGMDLYDLEDLADIIGKKKAGDKVKITYVRDGKVSTTWVTLAERDENFFKNNPGPSYRIEQMFDEMPGSRIWIEDDHVRSNAEDHGGPLLGVLMIHTEKRININGTETVEKTDGAKVDDVVPNSTAAEIGILKGDKIVAVNGSPVTKPSEVTAIISRMKAGDKVAVEYERDGKRLASSGVLKDRNHFDLPDWRNENVEIMSMRGEMGEEMIGRMHAMVEEARTRAAGGNGGTTIREFRMVIKMDELSPAEAQSLSSKTGQPIKAESDLDLRGLTLSPNPSTGKFNLGFELPSKGTAHIDVMDMNGNVIYSEEMNDFQGRYHKEFDISNKAKGIYVMRITQNGKSFTRKIVSQ